MSYSSPEPEKSAFHCPHCNAYAHQEWIFNLSGSESERSAVRRSDLTKDYFASKCMHCNKFALWHGLTMIYPNVTIAPLSEEDMPDEIKKDFEEACQVFTISPRSSAALLRLVIQKLCKHLGYPSKKIDDDIGQMVADGLEPTVQQAFDAVRVIGNQAVHPGQIDLRDDPSTALELFNLVNFIVQEMITRKQRVKVIYSKLSQDQIRHIEDRNKKLKPTTHP